MVSVEWLNLKTGASGLGLLDALMGKMDEWREKKKWIDGREDRVNGFVRNGMESQGRRVSRLPSSLSKLSLGLSFVGIDNEITGDLGADLTPAMAWDEEAQ